MKTVQIYGTNLFKFLFSSFRCLFFSFHFLGLLFLAFYFVGLHLFDISFQKFTIINLLGNSVFIFFCHAKLSYYLSCGSVSHCCL